MIARILAAVDTSPRAPLVADAALELAERFEAVVFFFHAITIPPEFPAAAHTYEKDPLPEYLAARAKEQLAVHASASPRARVTAPVVAIGQPWHAILSAADELDVDVIVVGSHGYNVVDRFLGTTAANVANRATRNVLVVHTREAARGSFRSPDPPASI